MPDDAVNADRVSTANSGETANAVRITPNGIQALWVRVPEQSLAIHSPDCDPGMPHIAACLNSETVARLLRGDGQRTAARGGKASSAVQVRLLGYRARRRAALRYRVRDSDGTERTLVGKTVHDDRGTKSLALHHRMYEQIQRYSGSRIRIPPPFAYDRELRMALSAWSPGRKLEHVSTSTRDCVWASADALAGLHRCNVEEAPRFTVENECHIIRRWHSVLQNIDPGKADATASLVEYLLARARTIPPADVRTIHRDFYERQLVVTRHHVTILDLDTVSRGDPALDLGNFLAHLALRPARRSDAIERLAVLAASFLDRYERQSGGVDRTAVAFYVCSAFFRLGAVHAFRFATGRCAEALWELARRQVEQELFTVKHWLSGGRVERALRPVTLR